MHQSPRTNPAENYSMPFYDRKNLRLTNYDYSQEGFYFVTICTHERAYLFGDVANGQMQPNQWGTIVKECWYEIPIHFSTVYLDEFVIMPNHVHGIIVMEGGETPPLRPTLGQVVAYYKYQSTKQINILRNLQGTRIWQRNYYEHVIRNDKDLDQTRQYIQFNPLLWDEDVYNSP